MAERKNTWVDWATAVVPLVTSLTGLAVWFGYQIVSSRARYFGLDPSVLGFTTQDFVLRSVSALLKPMLYLLLALLAMLVAHHAVHQVLARKRWDRGLRRAAVVTVIVGILCSVRGLEWIDEAGASDFTFACQGGSLGQWWRPSVLALGLILTAHGWWLLRRVSGAPAGSAAISRIAVTLVALVFVTTTFWSFSVYAHAAGALQAHHYACSQFSTMPQVVVFSARALSLEQAGDGTAAHRITNPDSLYRWRYTGLRLLLRIDEKYFLVPARWAGQGDSTILLTETPGVRFEFTPPKEL